MKTLIALLALLIASSAAADVYDFGGPTTTDNDDTCDIAQLPAATLLLPYFEVDLENRQSESTLFSITNVTNVEQIAHVTLWTDLAYPVVAFDVYLTGYDVQAINLYDVIKLGRVAPPRGTGRTVSDHGDYSDANPALDLAACDSIPSTLAPAVVTRMQRAFTTGVLGSCERAGMVHQRAIGYATIDVVSACNSMLTPEDPAYYQGLLRFDNVLTGEAFQTNSAESFAQGSPLVHIRAIPDGGGKPFPYQRTFYGRYQRAGTPKADARQPLPTVFATRWTDGGGDFQTSLKIWRERLTPGDPACNSSGAQLEFFTELVKFDEEENAFGVLPVCGIFCDFTDEYRFAAASRTRIGDHNFPRLTNGAIDGWLYLNLDSEDRDGIGTQAWVVNSMRAEGRYSVDTDAIALGNGCTLPPRASEVSDTSPYTIGPAPNVQPAGSNDDTCDIALAPAATLLLPWFEVDIASRTGENTVFSITNAGDLAQIAHVTLWSRTGSPVLTFDVFLTGYDVQSISLYDVIVSREIVPPQGTGYERPGSPVGHFSTDENPALDVESCRNIPREVPLETRTRVLEALTLHGHAVGYATIDVVAACNSMLTPADPAYYQGTLRYDNVLMGDFVQIDRGQNYAQASTMVHVRAIPEGGSFAQRNADPLRYAVNFPRTFYSRFQTWFNKVTDARQPLPSTFAARWIDGGAGSFETYLKIWREGTGTPVAADLVTFDEEENALGRQAICHGNACVDLIPDLPSAGRHDPTDRPFPRLDGPLGGWIYLNLDDPESPGASQGWVVTSLRAEGRYSADLDATPLGNGCSRPVGESEASTYPANDIVIGPANDVNP